MNHDKLEIKVGFFVFLGLAVIALMAVQFGRFGQNVSDFYELNVSFNNAGGLLKNSDVLLSGAPVGRVAEKPEVSPERIGTVVVKLLIRNSMKLPKGSTFSIGSTGMMGDRFVEITPPAGFDPDHFKPEDAATVYQPGETIQGTRAGGFAELTKQGEVVMQKLSENLDTLKATMDRLHNTVLSDANMNNLSATFANIKTTGENLATASKGIDEVIGGAKVAVATVQETMNTAKETVSSAKSAIDTAGQAAEDIRKAIDDARKVLSGVDVAVGHVNDILQTARRGPGVVPMLLSNPEVAANVNALITNLRRHGILFYRDSKSREKPPVVVPAQKVAR